MELLLVADLNEANYDCDAMQVYDTIIHSRLVWINKAIRRI